MTRTAATTKLNREDKPLLLSSFLHFIWLEMESISKMKYSKKLQQKYLPSFKKYNKYLDQNEKVD